MVENLQCVFSPLKNVEATTFQLWNNKYTYQNIRTLRLQADLTGLMYASYHNHPEVAQALIDAGCELDAVGSVSVILFYRKMGCQKIFLLFFQRTIRWGYSLELP